VTLSSASGPLHAGMTATVLLGPPDVTSPAVNASGGIDAWSPYPSIPPESVSIITLRG